MNFRYSAIQCPCSKNIKFPKELMLVCSRCLNIGHLYCYGYISKADIHGNFFCYLCTLLEQNMTPFVMRKLAILRFYVGHLHVKGRLHPAFYSDLNHYRLTELLTRDFRIIKSTDTDCLDIHEYYLKRAVAELFYPMCANVTRSILIDKWLSKFN